jgi:hypothetical protein
MNEEKFTEIELKFKTLVELIDQCLKGDATYEPEVLDGMLGNIMDAFALAYEDADADEDAISQDDISDYDSDDSDVSFTECEREHIKSPEHQAFLKKYSLKPSDEESLLFKETEVSL